MKATNPAPAQMPKASTQSQPDLPPQNWLATLSAGLISGVITTIFTISLVGLIFSGKLARYVPQGVGWFLTGAVILGLWIAIASSYKGNVASPQGKPAIVLALAAAAISASVAAHQLLPTIMMLLVITALLAGVCLYFLGHFRLGNLTRFLPYPVIGGFQVGTGWLIIVGAFSVLTGHKLQIENLGILFSAGVLLKWLPTLAFAAMMLIVLRIRAHFLSLSVMLLVGFALFYGIVWASGASLTDVRAAGWLLGPFPESRLWQYPGVTHVAWGALSSQIPTIMAAVLLIATDVLLNAVAIEVSTQARLDLDQELKSTGLANFATGLVGGLAGYNAISLCLLNHKVGASNRITAVLSALVCAVFLLWGLPLLDYFPVVVIGGLLLFIGLAFMTEWLWDGWSRLSLIDYLLLLMILVLIASLGFIEGVSIGLLIAMAIFIVNYSRTNVVKLELSGKELRSNRERQPEETRRLDLAGRQIRVFKLQGFVFFGTANSLLELYRGLFDSNTKINNIVNANTALSADTKDSTETSSNAKVDATTDASTDAATDATTDASTDAATDAPIRFVILDFRAVTGIDSSAAASFRQMTQFSATHGTRLLFANVPSDVARVLDSHHLRKTTQELLGTDAHLDHCLEWCEDQLLAESTDAIEAPSFAAMLAAIFTEDEGRRFQKALIRQEVAKEEIVFQEGQPGDSLLFVEQGQVVAWVLDPFGERERIRSFGPGAIVGEMGLYTHASRSATVATVVPSVLFLLTRAALDELEREDPLLAITFHRYIARILAERLGQTNHTLKFLLK